MSIIHHSLSKFYLTCVQLKKMIMENRRDFIRKAGILALAGFATPLIAFSEERGLSNAAVEPFSADGEFSLPPLPYAYDALEPHIDKMTMEIHHTKHHQAYVTNLNKALTAAGIKNGNLDDIIAHVSKYETVVRNNAGGHWNHSFFWKIMKPGGSQPDGKIREMIDGTFGSIDEFKTKFNDTALKRFGSGWAWLIVDEKKKLTIGSTPNQDNPLMDLSDLKGIPVLGIDVWEHAYYLKYQNKRNEYVNAWWNLVNWNEVNTNLALAMKM